MALTVWLGNLSGETSDRMSSVRTYLLSLFSGISDGSNSFDTVRIISASDSIGKKDLLCYVVSNFDKSVVKNFDSTVTGGSGVAGNTNFRTGDTNISASEIYMDVITNACDNVEKGMANLIFHELMHNKAVMGDALHSQGGGGLAAEVVTQDTSRSQGNVDFMKARLSKEVTQWQGGFVKS